MINTLIPFLSLKANGINVTIVSKIITHLGNYSPWLYHYSLSNNNNNNAHFFIYNLLTPPVN